MSCAGHMRCQCLPQGLARAATAPRSARRNARTRADPAFMPRRQALDGDGGAEGSGSRNGLNRPLSDPGFRGAGHASGTACSLRVTGSRAAASMSRRWAMYMSSGGGAAACLRVRARASPDPRSKTPVPATEPCGTALGETASRRRQEMRPACRTQPDRFAPGGSHVDIEWLRLLVATVNPTFVANENATVLACCFVRPRAAVVMTSPRMERGTDVRMGDQDVAEALSRAGRIAV